MRELEFGKSMVPQVLYGVEGRLGADDRYTYIRVSCLYDASVEYYVRLEDFKLAYNLLVREIRSTDFGSFMQIPVYMVRPEDGRKLKKVPGLCLGSPGEFTIGKRHVTTATNHARIGYIGVGIRLTDLEAGGDLSDIIKELEETKTSKLNMLRFKGERFNLGRFSASKHVESYTIERGSDIVYLSRIKIDRPDIKLDSRILNGCMLIGEVKPTLRGCASLDLRNCELIESTQFWGLEIVLGERCVLYNVEFHNCKVMCSKFVFGHEIAAFQSEITFMDGCDIYEARLGQTSLFVDDNFNLPVDRRLTWEEYSAVYGLGKEG